jgi:cytochrome c oxidase subunit 7
VIDWSKYPPPPRAPGSYQVRNLPPIVGRLRRQILLDISVAFGIGMTMGYLFWYGYHVPAVRRRDAFYENLERERIAKYGGTFRHPMSQDIHVFLIYLILPCMI